MEIQLETLSKSELVTLVLNQQKERLRLEKTAAEKDRELARKDALIGQLQRMLFGQKRERFEAPENQIPLPFGPDPEQETQRAQVHE